MSSRLQIRLFYFFPLIAVVTLTSYFQTEYEIKTERAIAYNFPNQSIGKAWVKFFKYNRTYTALNISFEFFQDVDLEAMVTLRVYTFRSNEYRMNGLYMQRNACDDLKQNYFGIADAFYRCGNFTRCPMKKGYYVSCNFGPNSTAFPPLMPEGQFRTDHTYSYRKQNLFRLEYYFKVESNKFKQFG